MDLQQLSGERSLADGIVVCQDDALARAHATKDVQRVYCTVIPILHSVRSSSIG